MKSALYVGASLAFFSLAGSSFATKEEQAHYLYQEYTAVGENVQLERVSLGLVDDRSYNVSCEVVDAASMPVG